MIAEMPTYSVHLIRSAHVPDEVHWYVRKSWWRVSTGGNSRKIVGGILTGITPQMTEPEILRLGLEAALRTVGRLGDGGQGVTVDSTAE